VNSPIVFERAGKSRIERSYIAQFVEPEDLLRFGFVVTATSRKQEQKNKRLKKFSFRKLKKHTQVYANNGRRLLVP
jgi:hypothetical protein